jgi:hypothetical protein
MGFNINNLDPSQLKDIDMSFINSLVPGLSALEQTLIGYAIITVVGGIAGWYFKTKLQMAAFNLVMSLVGVLVVISLLGITYILLKNGQSVNQANALAALQTMYTSDEADTALDTAGDAAGDAADSL